MVNEYLVLKHTLVSA